MLAEQGFGPTAGHLVGVRHPTTVDTRDHRPILVSHLLGHPHRMFAGRQHHVRVRVVGLIWVPIADAAALQAS